jgi:YggT family protein
MIELIRAAAMVVTVLIIARAVLSWAGPSASNAVVRWVYRVTDPILRPIQSLIPAFGGIDFSPLIAIVLVQLARDLLVRLLVELA